MNAEELRERQAPLKAHYRQDPSSAVWTLRSKGRVSQNDLTCILETAKAGVPAGLHPATGGSGEAACSGDMLLDALVSCAGVTLAAVATSMGIALVDATITATGEVDFRGTLGVSRDTLVGFRTINLAFAIQSDATSEKVGKLVELTERYCVVLQTLAKPPSVRVQVI